MAPFVWGQMPLNQLASEREKTPLFTLGSHPFMALLCCFCPQTKCVEYIGTCGLYISMWSRIPRFSCQLQSSEWPLFLFRWESALTASHCPTGCIGVFAHLDLLGCRERVKTHQSRAKTTRAHLEQIYHRSTSGLKATTRITDPHFNAMDHEPNSNSPFWPSFRKRISFPHAKWNELPLFLRWPFPLCNNVLLLSLTPAEDPGMHTTTTRLHTYMDGRRYASF